MEKFHGQTQFIRVKSLAGAPCLIKTGWTSAPKAVGKRLFKIVAQPDGVISIDLKRGEEVVLYTGVKPSSFVMDAVQSDKHVNYWGLH